MLISLSNKFIAINIPKTGTRSLRGYLAMQNQHWDGRSDRRIVDIIATKDSTIFPQHGTLTHCMQDAKNVGLDISSYFTFTFVRNPWVRYVSHMLWHNEKYDTTVSIELLMNTHLSQYEYLHDKQSGKQVDYIAKFENYEKEILKLSDRLNFDLDINTIRHLNKNKKYNYKDYYTDDLVEMVREKESKIIDIMGYTYD